MTTVPIPVRKMHDDGYITVRYLHPDGSEFDEELPESMLLGAEPRPITAIWDKEYKLGNQERVTTHETLPNLKYLSDVDPLLFEQVLCRLESCELQESYVWSQRLMENKMHPQDSSTSKDYAPIYRAMLRAIPVASELGDNHYEANRLIRRARDIVKYLGHDHLAAAAIFYWIVEGDNKFLKPKINYKKCEQDIAYIDQNIEAVMLVRDELKRIRACDQETITDVINGSSSLSNGFI